MAGLWPIVAATCFGIVLPPTAATSHYERPPCQADEVQGEILGLSGFVCSPRCAEGSYDCPGDVPDLAAARPQCMLKDADQGAFCALLCTVDSQCPSSARCTRLQQAGIGVCMYPLAFSDWVRTANIRKLSYGLPQRTDRKVPPGVVQKAVAAVQSLKTKYGIQDGDADVVTVKEFLTSLSGGMAPAAPAGWGIATAAPVGGTGAYVPQPSGAYAVPPASPASHVGAAVTAAGPQPGAASEISRTLDAYERDFSYHGARLSEGIPGLEREVNDAMYKAEHITEFRMASDLLRTILEIAAVYLIIGVVYKHQALGAVGVDMIPHIGFWMEYPKMVADGVQYSKDVVGGYLGVDLGSSYSGSGGFGGGSGFEPLGRGERDTFAQFEPSKA